MSDNEVSEMWKAWRQHSQEKRRANRTNSPHLLTEAGIPFTVKNDGAHLIVDNRFDFWPGTGRWIKRDTGRKGFGVHSLINAIRKDRQ